MPEAEQSARQDAGSRPPRRSSWRRWVLAAGLVLAVVAVYALGLQHYLSWDYFRAHLDDLQRTVQDDLPLAALVFFLLYVAVTALSLPVATVVSLVGGALFGRWLGTGLVIVAATVGAVLAFLSSRYVLGDFVQRRVGGRLAALIRGVAQEGAYYLFALRLVPAFPFFLINLGMGLTPIRLWTYTWVSFVGMLPGTFVYVNAGTALGSIESPAGILSPGVLVSFALLGLAPLAFRLLARRKAHH
jgi:uncharacterized membrane protein YdjX (TVP38/TMEM64 family)